MTTDTIYKTFESFNNRIEKFKAVVDSALKYFFNTPSLGGWDNADVLSEITDIIENYDITIDELKIVIDNNSKNPHYKYLRNIHKAMIHDQKYPDEDLKNI